MALGFIGRVRRFEWAADQFGFQFVPAPRRRLNRSDGGAGARDRAVCIQCYSKTENGNRIVAGFPQRQPCMYGTAQRTRNDDAPHNLSRRKACSNLEKAAQRNPLSVVRPLQFKLCIET